MDHTKPTLYVVAGPNGCGKSTFTRSRFSHLRIVDPDVIARQIAPEAPLGVAVAAGREAVHIQKAAITMRDTFVVETTLSGRRVLRFMEHAKAEGYRLELHFVCVDSIEKALDRISSRVAEGGHDVGTEDVRRRFVRAQENLSAAIALSDESRLYDNTDMDEPYRIVAVLTDAESWFVEHPPAWLPSTIHSR